MTPEEKQPELQRHHDIILATIDYLHSLHAGSFVLDNEDMIADHYEQQKLQVEKYFNQGRLDKLQHRLATLTKRLQNTVDDVNFTNYIKEKTGYEIDLFADLRKRVDIILLQNGIRDQKELSDAGAMLDYLLTKSTETEAVEQLKSLLSNYPYDKHESSREPDNPVQYEASSPDGKHKLFVLQSSNGTDGSTSVLIQFASGASGAVYSVRGVCPGIKASWKGNSAISIETKSEYDAAVQHKQARSFDHIIQIEYTNY